MPWFFGRGRARRRSGGKRRHAPAPFRVRQLERRRVLDGAAASALEPALTTQETVVVAPVVSDQLVVDWLTVEESASESSAAASAFMAAAVAGSGGDMAAFGAENNPPEVLAGFDQEINEGDFLDLSGLDGAPPLGLILDDAGDTHTATVNWGDGTGDQPATVFPSGGFGSPIGGTHTYAEGDAPYTDYTVTITATDQDGASNSDTFIVRVHNVAPTVNVDAPAPISENDTLTLIGSYTDPGVRDSQTMVVTWGDPNDAQVSTFSITALQDSMGNDTLFVDDTFMSTTGDAMLTITSIDVMTGEVGFRVQHQYFDDGLAPGNVTPSDSSTITVTMTDADGESGDDEVMVEVQNVAPELSDPLDVVILENGTATLITTLTDPGTLDVFSVDVNWQDGTSDTISGLGVSDVSGTVGSTMYSWVAASRQLTVEHQYFDDDPTVTTEDEYHVTLTPHDDDSGTGETQIATVTVQNVAPQLSDPLDVVIPENDTATLVTTLTDPGSLDVFSVDVNWQDGTIDTISGLGLSDVSGTVGGTMYTWVATTRQLTVKHQYLDDDPTVTSQDDYLVTLTPHDDDSGTGEMQAATVTVQNVAPSVALDPVTMIDENGTAVLSGTISDIGSLDTFTLDVTWGDPLSPDNVQSFALGTVALTQAADGIDWDPLTRSFTVSHQYLDDNPSVTTFDDYTIDVTATDDDSLSGVDSETVRVNNVLPALMVGDPIMIDEGVLLDMTGDDGAPNVASFADVGTLDLHAAQIDWGDGHVETGMIAQGAGFGTIGGSHTYADDGVYTVVIRLADDDMSSFSMPANFNSGTLGVDFVQATFTVTVNNVAPSLTGTDGVTVEEGHAFTLASLGVGLEDPGFDNPLNPTVPMIGDPFAETFTSYQINWGDGTMPTAVSIVDRVSGAPTVTSKAGFDHLAHTYADDGAYTVTIRVADDNMSGDFVGGTNGVDFIDLQFTIVVENVVPMIDSVTPSTVNIFESDDVSFTALFSDFGFDNGANPNLAVPPLISLPKEESFAYFIDWGDGRDQVGTMSVADMNGAPGMLSTGMFGDTHNYADDGVYQVTIRIADDNMLAFVDAAMFQLDGGGTAGVDFVEYTFLVTVNNIDPSFVPIMGQPIQADDVNTNGETTLRVNFSDFGYDNPLNTDPFMPPAVGNPLAETFTYIIDWGDGTVDTISVTGGSAVINSQTTVLTSNRVSGDATTLTTGGSEIMHTYLGPPDPLNPTADIIITLTLVDDNGGSVSAQVAIGNPGIDTVNVAIDTTPQVPKLEFVPPAPIQVLIDQTSSSIQNLQSQTGRVARSELAVTSERFLELVSYSPDGQETGRYILKEEALANLRALFASLPDGHYRIYLVRTETNARRLVIEVYVRGGRVIDPSDDSEGTRDRPPTESQQIEAPPIEENPFIVPAGEAAEPNAGIVPEQEPAASVAGWGIEEAVVALPVTEQIEAKEFTARSLRWGVPLAGLALAAVGRGRWAEEVGQAFERADRGSWQRLHRAGRLRRNRKTLKAVCEPPGASPRG
jgi:hypothetical protein